MGISRESGSFTNSVDPDEMQHFAAFHLGLQCLQKNAFRCFLNTQGLKTVKTWIK